jgi:hypothetical protein
LHDPLLQSPPKRHFLPGSHGLHEPPQSTSVSSPFAIWSEHVAGTTTSVICTSDVFASLDASFDAPPASLDASSGSACK